MIYRYFIKQIKLANKMKNKQIPCCQNSSKPNRKILERSKVDTNNTQIHDFHNCNIGVKFEVNAKK